MTLEQMLRWKQGSFTEYENIINEQERLLKNVKKLNLEIEKAEDARSVFNYYNPAETEKWLDHNNRVKLLLREKERIGMLIKENNQRLEREFY